MTEIHESPDAADRFRRLMAILEANQKYLQAARVEDDILVAYKELLRYLRSRPPATKAEIVGPRRASQVYSKTAAPQFSEDQIRAMTATEVSALASNPEITRRQLEQIARIRFGVTTGGLSNLRTRDALVQKLLTLVGHEATHESISRAVDAASPLKQESGGT